VNRTLLLRLDGPLQSWTSQPPTAQTTVQFPTATDLIGMIVTAFETGRGEDGAELRFLETAVRADEPGRHVNDFQQSRHRRRQPPTATEEARIKVLRRGFAADAVFTAAVGGTAATVESAASALARPSRQLFLGRRCCPPAAPILLGLSDRSALEALGAVPYQGHRDRPPAYFDVALYSPEQEVPDDDAGADPGIMPDRRRWTRTDVVVSS